MYKINKIEKEKQKAHITEKIIIIILYIIVIPVIIFNFTLIIKSFINQSEIPDFFGYKNFIIISKSMEPAIMSGDAIIVKEIHQSEVKINDIISFNDNGTITTHRIVAIIEENGIKKYKTKGDNNNIEDKEEITYDKIEGKYQLKIKGFGVIIKILRNKLTLLLLVMLLGLNCWYSYRISNRKQGRKKKRKEFNLKKNKSH